MILVIEDDGGVREALRRSLVLVGYEVQLAADGEQALESVVRAEPDAVVLDVGLPGIDGLELCRRVRRLGSRVPILMLSARDGVGDRIAGLDVGADDYMIKPFDDAELKARLRALLRRANGSGAAEELAFAELRLQPARAAVQVGDTLVELTRTEYRLLELMMRNPGRVLPHHLMYESVWGYDFGATSNALRVYIGYLRRKLAAAGSRELIHTVRGLGYVLREP